MVKAHALYFCSAELVSRVDAIQIRYDAIQCYTMTCIVPSMLSHHTSRIQYEQHPRPRRHSHPRTDTPWTPGPPLHSHTANHLPIFTAQHVDAVIAAGNGNALCIVRDTQTGVAAPREGC